MHVVLNHEIVGIHDERCIPLFPERIAELASQGVDPNQAHPWHWRHEGADLVVVENGTEARRYHVAEWSNAGPESVCGGWGWYDGPPCPRCHENEP